MTDNVSTSGARSIDSAYHRLFRERQRRRIVAAAESLFAAGGLAAACTGRAANAANVSQAMLHSHFGTTQELCEEVVKHNAESRLAYLRERLLSIPVMPPVPCIESMARLTVLACVGPAGNATVMQRALVEMPEFASDVYRAEIGATEALWNAEIARRFEGSPVRARLAVHVVPYAVHTCMAFGLWLAALRHKPATAEGHARQYAEGIVHVARAVLELRTNSLQAAS